MCRLFWIAAWLCVTPTVCAASVNKSRVPVLYIINYSADNHLVRPSLLAMTKKWKPDLFHAGKDGPFTHNWGPIAGWGGENVYGGGKHRQAYHRRLSPAELDQKFAACRRYTKAMHESGVGKFYHYVCGFTLGGNPDAKARYGFWEFYDHWDEYLRFGIGPKPAHDPIQWMMRKPDGSCCFIYKRDYTSYLPGTRWAACMNNPHWRQWMAAVFRASASVGFDGIFPDNCFCRCCCKYCQAEFAKFVEREHRPTKQMATHEDGGRAWFDTQEFWIDTIARWMTDMRAEARKINPDFGIFPNNGTHPGYKRFSTACDYMMGEGDFWDFGPRGFGTIWFHKDPGMVRRPLAGGLALKRYRDLIISYKYTAAQGGRPAVVWLTHGGQARSEEATELRFCEAMAFGAGACTFGRPSTPPETYARYRRFFQTRRRLYDGLEPWCKVGLAYFPRQALHGNMRHVSLVWAIADALNARCIPYRVVTETDCRAGRLDDLNMLFVPGVDHIELAELRALRSFAFSGNTIAFHAGPPTHDEYYRPIADDLGFPLQGGRVGAGRVVVGREVVKAADVAALCREGLGRDPCITPDGPESGPPGLRLEMRFKPDETRMVLHLVNYNVPLGKAAARVEDLENLKLRLPLPKGWKPTRALLHNSHRDSPDVLALQASGSAFVEVTVPKLHIYSVLEVSE